ncbi:HtaA domain-containing protein [Streptomyces sp. NBC_00006]|uniref:HtaA domain-containing protein n=1 Tax=Streptomyces sp. NBC_00006 TaxID=2975619 RepID=UPI0022551500|nr:HtaA domain-containing protein [Streptomyces sp. NBC_00006]MCX5533883.1 HtaA domain-containing protein [Streptomyces sp. NBC_00006]
MSHTGHPITRHPIALAAATAVALGSGALSLPAFAAEKAAPGAEKAAPSVELKDGTLDWGIKESFRKYVTGIALGKIEATDGATQAAGNGAFTFGGGTGTYDTATHGTDTKFKGAVRFASTAHRFDIKVADVKVVTSGTTGHIDADVTLNGSTQNDIEFATLDLSAVKPGQGAGGAMTFKDIPATLTADGAKAFNGMYEEGTALDPATLTVTAASSPTSPAPTKSPTKSPSPTDTATTEPRPTKTATPTGKPTASTSTAPAAAVSGEIVDGNLDWGVKESFRTYITGPIAKGKVELSGGAGKNGSGYRFGDASGSYDADAKSLDAKFAGKVRFLGHEEGGEYALDLQFSELRVTAEGGSGKLVADVSSKDQETGKVSTYDGLTVATLKLGSGALTAKNDVVEVDGAAAALTAGGAKAFGGFYEAGAALDPVTAAVSLDENAELPTGPNGGTSGGTSGTTGGTGSTTGGTGSTTGGSLASTGADVPAGPLAAAAALIAAAGAGTVYATRRRRTQS